MSVPPKQSKKSMYKDHKKKQFKQQQEQIAIVSKPLRNIEFPSHISKVNYLSLESFEANLEDTITQQAYHSVIMENQHLFANKLVLHITQGVNCLYSIFAAKAGSKKVYCVINGQSERQLQNVEMMKEMIKENDLQQRIEVMIWKNFNAEIDIIIGEPMGYCLHFDGLLDRIIEARDLYLSEGGIIFPNQLSFKCAVVHDQYFSDHKLSYWDDVYGIPMVSMKQWIFHQPIIRVVDPTLIVSKATKIITFNLQTVTYDEIIKVDKVVEVDLLGPCKANGVVYWFEANFGHSIQAKDIKASPWVDSTKFTQVTLYWPTILQYKGGKLRLRIKGQKCPKQGYSVISNEIDDKIYQYSFS